MTGKRNARMSNSFISPEKGKEQLQNVRKHVIENLSLSFVVIAREHVGTQSRQGTLVREHVDKQDKLVREYIRSQDTLALEHVSM